MKGDTSHGISSRRDLLDGRAREIELRDTEEQAARWAQALAPHFVAQLPPPPGEASTPGGWRASDTALTLPAQGAAASAVAPTGPSEASNDEPQRIVLNVQTRDLGELSLVLDRTNGAVRVVIGVHDAASIERMLPERDALVRQLQGSGLTVQSIQIVAQNELGTVLAPSGPVGRPRAFVEPDRLPDDKEKTRRRTSRKLNLIG